MLCLSRKQSEKLILGDGPNKIEVTVAKISGNRVTLGIQAPPAVKVVRGDAKAA